MSCFDYNDTYDLRGKPLRHTCNVRVKGLEPPSLAAPDPKSGVSTNFTTPAFLYNRLNWVF